MAGHDVSLLAFFLKWADRQGWQVPVIHLRAIHWLETRGDLAVLRCFRGFGKSTLLAIYNAWRYHQDPTYRILHQGESDPTAYKTSRDTKAVLLNHPWTRDMLREGEVEQWWVKGATDARNASMYAKGILSNVTSARADECQNDDVEVPRNITTPEAREKLRYRLGEQTHILVPGGRKLYVGTPHTHDSLYDEQERMGADCLTIRMFEREQRIDSADARQYAAAFKPEIVFAGIGEFTRVLVEGKDYTIKAGRVTFTEPPGCVVDLYSGCAWPERFSLHELAKRRKECRTLNEWDSQYQLHAKPVAETRLDPDKLLPYDCEPVLRYANNTPSLWLGNTQIVGVKARWDCSLGKIDGDASAVSVVFTDAAGRLYWHRAAGLTGELEVMAPDDKTLVGGQVFQLIQLLAPLQVPNIVVETNGPGGFVPAIARRHLKPFGISVTEDFETHNKQKRILDAFEAPLSSGFLWAHVSVIDGPAAQQLRDFNPLVKNAPDDYIDSAAGAIAATPVRVGRIVGKPTAGAREDWRPSGGVHEVELET